MPQDAPTQPTPLFTAAEAETRTGVPAATLRQWERRYGVPAPARSASATPSPVAVSGLVVEE